MSYLGERFGFEEVDLTNDEELEVYELIKKADQKRIDFYSIIASICSTIMILLDFIVFNDSNHKLYLFSDITLLIGSLFLIYNLSFHDLNESKYKKAFKTLSYKLFVPLILLWATSIVALEPKSVLNIISFYFVFFLIIFSIYIQYRTLIIYYIAILFTYLSLSFVLKNQIFSESFLAIIIVCVIILPFYYYFKKLKYVSTASHYKLDLLRSNLESEVIIRINELQQVNSNLENEIGKRKIVESKLRETLKQAELSDRLKSEFLANISHEIRTPLNSIVGFSQMITEDGVSDEMKVQFQELIASNTMYLLSTIDDIFDASLLQADQIKPINKSLNVNSFLENVYYETNGIGVKYQKNHLLIVKKLMNNQNLKIVTDEFYLKKAMIRLIDNAFKFTKEGQIEIGVRQTMDTIEFYVADTGIGIKEKDQLIIFEPFVQGNGSFSRGFGGSGLGLTIAKGMTKALGASFSFISKENEGSTFSITFNKIVIDRT